MARKLATEERVRVPAGVVVAAAVLGIMAFIGLLLVAFSAYVQFGTNSALIPYIPTVRMAAAGLDALVFALAILAACTIVGLCRLKIWARYSITLLGLLDLIVFGLLTAGVLIFRARSGMAALPIPNNPGLTLGAILIGIAVVFGILALIGVWWIVYFNTDHTRMVFRHAEAGIPVPDPNDKSFLGLS